MKKLIARGALGLLTGSLWAACMGPFCYDDVGASISGLIVDGNGAAMPTMSSTTISGVTPRGVGQQIMCTTCANGGVGAQGVCVDTATNKNAWVMASSSTQKCQ